MLTYKKVKQDLIANSITFDVTELSPLLTDVFIDVISLDGLAGSPVTPTVGTYEIYVKTDPNGGFKAISDNGSLAAGKTGGSGLADGVAEGSSFSSFAHEIKVVPTGTDVAVAYQVIVKQIG